MPDNLASRVVENLATRGPQTGGTALVAGFQGDSGNDNVQRVYLTPDCSTAYVEFPTDAVVTSQELTTSRSPFTGTAYWIPKNQDITCWISTPLTADKLDATLIKAQATSPAPNMVVQGTERFDPISIATGAWGVAGTLGLQDDIVEGATDVAKKVGSWVSSWF
jgi:hypothetical protein